ncbi:iron complex outermembrane recepter protein [Saccharicrinis carchari]|uniref:Iron complex outermembrane recepter protein n=1 Tax=Saccharicrinis carchari TaxID=1168039 RepID=A0A521F563_SACCC|nr:TonB-dependent receptor [Saccharicrinis carchari]SMO91322.1 iron complex outermembrane recepter protein [Saccharicrinis carchari]
MKRLSKIKMYITVQLMFLSVLAFCQDVNIEGTVLDVNKEPMPGVTVILKNTTTGTITRPDGTFSLAAKDGDVLVFSFIGFISQEKVVVYGKNIIVELESEVFGVDEVVVIGYGSLKKDDATGSVSSVSTKDFNKGAITSPQDLLVGKASGVQITTAGGEPGSAATIRIRGGSSLSASNDPLFIIDGVPIDNDGVSGMRNPLNTINPNDIESFSVLKDASATAIYGSRASNGVIIITTKKGAKGGLKFNYNANASVGFRTNEIETFSADDYRQLISARYGEGSNARALLGHADTDWQKEIFQTSFGHDHNFSMSGSKLNTLFRLSLGYSNQKGLLKTSGLDRYTANLSVSPSLFDNHLKMELNLKGMYIENRFTDNGAINTAMLFDPTQEVYDQTSDYGGYFTWMDGNKPGTLATSNPLALLQQRQDRSEVYRSIGNAKFDYSFHFLPELTVTLNMGYDYSMSDGTVFIPEEAAFAYRKASDGSDISGEDRSYGQDKKNELLDFYLKYEKQLPSINSKLNVMGGYSWQHFWRENEVKATSVNGAYLITPEQITPTENYLVSFFGRMNYTLKDRYLLTVTVRQDGTSRFSEDNCWGMFPSLALAWRLKEETFLKNIDAVSNLKLRLGYGITGQQYITSDNYPYLAKYNLSRGTARYLMGNEWVTMARPNGYDANLKWEETTTFNVGIDYGFLDERINGSIELYQRETKDLINKIPVAAGTNFTNVILTNVGTLQNKGIEFNLNVRPIVAQDLFWEIGFNLSRNVNEITKLTNVDNPDYNGVQTGGISTGIGGYAKINSVGKPANSFYMFQQVYNGEGMPIEGLYADRTGDGLVNEKDMYHYKSSTPDFILGFSSRAEYKNWDFSFAARASLGNYMYNDLQASSANYQYVYNSNYLQNVPRSVLNTNFKHQQAHSDYYVQEASFVKLDNVSAGYSFEKLFNDKMDLRLSLTSQNIFVITDYEGVDPEVFNGIDNAVYPRPRTFVLGANILF